MLSTKFPTETDPSPTTFQLKNSRSFKFIQTRIKKNHLHKLMRKNRVSIKAIMNACVMLFSGFYEVCSELSLYVLFLRFSVHEFMCLCLCSYDGQLFPNDSHVFVLWFYLCSYDVQTCSYDSQFVSYDIIIFWFS